MNLRAIANAITSTINPNVDVIIKKYISRSFNQDGTANIVYENINTTAQIQPVSSYKLQHIQGFTMGGIYKYFYFNNDLKGVSAPDGNDEIILPNGDKYKVIEQSEGWYYTSGWTKVLGQRL